MANEITTYSTNGHSNIFEDVDDMIYNISPHDTIFLTTIKSDKCTGYQADWNSLATTPPTASNPRSEIWDGTAESYMLPTRYSNHVQCFGKAVAISDLMEDARKIGGSSELNSIGTDLIKQLKDEVEFSILNHSLPSSASSGVDKGYLKGVLGWVTTNTYSFSNATSATNEFKESIFLDNLQKADDAGGKVDMVIGNSYTTRKIASFLGHDKLSLNIDAADNKRYQGIDFYKSQFGTHKIYSSKILTTKSGNYDYCLLLDSSTWAFAWSQKLKLERQARKGTVTPLIVTARGTLKAFNENGNAVISNIAR